MAGMTAAERHQRIVARLREERIVTIASLTEELQCSRRTLLYDIEALAASDFPVETVRGRYGGGVKLPDWYHPKSNTLNATQLDLLIRVAPSLNPEERKVLNSIIDQFGPRQR